MKNSRNKNNSFLIAIYNDIYIYIYIYNTFVNMTHSSTLWDG